MSLGRREQAARLARRREALLAQSQAQRAAVAHAWAGLQRPLRWADLAVRAAGFVRRQPWTLALPLLAAVSLRRHWFAGLASSLPLLLRLWSAWRR